MRDLKVRREQKWVGILDAPVEELSILDGQVPNEVVLFYGHHYGFWVDDQELARLACSGAAHVDPLCPQGGFCKPPELVVCICANGHRTSFVLAAILFLLRVGHGATDEVVCSSSHHTRVKKLIVWHEEDEVDAGTA
eukprot:CAMPEP_0178430232 /NCGR_PEP_ID=MMETSP0689_2-20121128/31215_1 /TAXON_ID=160604 /ORGANISM="Amphidinium massartii, Strain CS-259" /LENGTH=136 /DNA_ID=CAMNT_0020052085 /DNA_START=359 /DNA_END=769 /DNA_ORIENTATION=+